MSDNCLLSLALIMRDAAGEVLECLKSVAEAVDEMVVVDTGSVDDSVAVVLQQVKLQILISINLQIC